MRPAMRVEGSEQTMGHHEGRGMPSDARRLPDGMDTASGSDRSTAPTGTIGGTDRRFPETPAGAEPTHIEGGAAEGAAQFAWSMPLESVSLTGRTVVTLVPIPGGPADTPAGTAVIDVLEDGDRAAALASLAGAVPASPNGVARLEWPAGMAEATMPPPLAALEPRHITWRDPVSVEGTTVLAIGAATVVLSSLG